ncbi:MAG: hypothetical protein KTR35_12425 [Gammaproteobacteria bacterium]|nr:hypothetical protein [Gammaproteobacteria bacterium]
MPVLIAPLPFKPPRLIDLSESMLTHHYEQEYGSVVQRLNQLNAELNALDWSGSEANTLIELTLSQQALANTMVLHETFYRSLGGEDGLGSPTTEPSGALGQTIQQTFGSVEDWRWQFVTLALSLGSKQGWIVLIWNPRFQRLENCCVIDSEQCVLGGVPLIALDVHPRAYQPDFNTRIADYLSAFMANLNWARAERRFVEATAQTDLSDENDETEKLMSPETLHNRLSHKQDTLVLDVCLLDDLPMRHDKLPGAVCVQSDGVIDIMKKIPKEATVVAYCMYGFQVSSMALEQLRANGFTAHKLAGGIATWRALGLNTEPYDG